MWGRKPREICTTVWVSVCVSVKDERRRGGFSLSIERLKGEWMGIDSGAQTLRAGGAHRARRWRHTGFPWAKNECSSRTVGTMSRWVGRRSSDFRFVFVCSRTTKFPIILVGGRSRKNSTNQSSHATLPISYSMGTTFIQCLLVFYILYWIVNISIFVGTNARLYH